MKSFLIISTCTLILTSCATSEYYMADDVYVVKPSDLPIGESTADETTYAAYKQRQIGESNDRQLYGDVTRNRFDNDNFYYFGNSYVPFLYSSQFPYGHQGAWMGYNSWYYQSMPGFYYGWNNGVWNGNSYGYTYPVYWHNGYNNYWCQQGGYGYGGYGYGGYNYGGTYAQNTYFGPRGSNSGYSNPHGRTTTGKLKSGTYSSGNTAHSTSYNRTSNSGNLEKRPISTINQSTVYRTNTPNGSRTNPSTNSSNSNRTYENADAAKRPRPTVYSNSTTRERTNTNVNSGRPTINSGSDYNRNSGTINSGSRGSSGAGSSRSGGTINSGRRP